MLHRVYNVGYIIIHKVWDLSKKREDIEIKASFCTTFINWVFTKKVLVVWLSIRTFIKNLWNYFNRQVFKVMLWK